MAVVFVTSAGAITEEIVQILQARGCLESLVAVLVRPIHITAAAAKCAGRFFLTDSIDQLLARSPASVLECAGHTAVTQYGPAVLAAGVDFIVASVGAFADPSAAAALLSATAQGQARLLVPSGAVAGLDGLLAARTAGISTVTYTSVKPPAAWIGTPAETLLTKPFSGDGDTGRIVLFDGTAREAARLYPRNVNVGMAVALASGLGPDRARVRLVADPAAVGPLGVIEAAGAFGALRLETLALAAAGNPKTSALTAHSILAAALHGVAVFEADPALLLSKVSTAHAADEETIRVASSSQAALAVVAVGVKREGDQTAQAGTQKNCSQF
jgi:aspartate dehydrogenase